MKNEIKVYDQNLEYLGTFSEIFETESEEQA